MDKVIKKATNVFINKDLLGFLTGQFIKKKDKQ